MKTPVRDCTHPTDTIRSRDTEGMRRASTLTLSAILTFALASIDTVHADIYVYPDMGQSVEQQNENKWECHQWAVQETGVDPEKIAQEATSRQAYQQPEGGYYGGALLRGGAFGGTLGAIGGAIAGVPGEGAAIGAAVAGVANVIRARQQVDEQNDYNQAVAQQHQAQLKQYDQAYATCMQGRGYTVS